MSESVLDQLAESSVNSGKGEYAAKGGFLQDTFPSIWEILARQEWKGRKRALGRLVVYCEPGCVSLCLSDRHTGQVAFHTAADGQEAFEGLEARLAAGEVDWRPDRKGRRA